MVSVMGLGIALLAAALAAEEPAKKIKVVKPPWQRLLQGADAKKAAEQEKQLEKWQEAGKFAEALKVAEALAELRRRAQGGDHWETVSARLTVEGLRRALRQNAEAQKEYAASFTLAREAETFQSKDRYREAQPLFEKILAISRKVLGEENPDTAQRYTDLADNLRAQDKFAEAEKYHRKALTILRKVVGEEHPHTGDSYNNVAVDQEYQGKYAESEKDFRKALAISRKVLGEDHEDTAQCYFNLARNQDNQNKYAEAETGHRKALAIRRKVLGEENLETVASYSNLASILSDQGKYAEAEESYRKDLVISRKMLGEEHPQTATSYNNLAYNHAAQGRYPEAEEGYRKALSICRKVLGEEHPDTAQGYNNLGANLSAQGRHREAEKDLRKALAIRRKVLGEDDSDTAQSYHNVASSLNAQGKYVQAEESYRKALTICRKVLGEEAPDTARCHDSLASNLQDQGKYQAAEAGFRQALAIRRKLLREEHLDTAINYHSLAFNLYAQGKHKEAESLFLCAAESFAKARLHIAATGLERATITSKRSPLPSLAAVLARNGKPIDAWRRFEESLARGIWDDVSARLRRPQVERDKQAQITARIDRLQKLIERAGTANAPPAQAKQREDLLGQLRQAYDELAAFTQQLEKTYGPIAGQIFSRGKIQEALPTDAALLGWLDIAGQPKAADPSGEHWAVLLRSAGDPIWVRLQGTGDKNAWTDADTQLPGRLRTALQSSTSKWQPLAERLRQQRLQPLTQHLKGVRQLIVLPSTALAGVPIEVIADGYTISYAHSGTMYAHLRQQPMPTGKGLLALADPVFETAVVAVKPQPLPPRGVLITRVLPGSKAFRAGLRANDVLLRYGETDLAGPVDFKPLPEKPESGQDIPVIVWRDGVTRKQPLYVRPGKLGIVIAKEPAPQALAEQHRLDRLLASRGGDEGKWNRLPGTRLEVAALQRLFGNELSRVLLDSEASEQRLDNLAQSGALSKYRYIHLATHGEVNDKFPLRSAVMLSRDRLPDDKQRTDLLISGQSIPDGRLSAEEVLGRWNLNADLVTLSACQTALGKYERGEGFVGFAQALVLSGSRSVCLSLWEVNDIATALLMERFYQNLLGKREGLTKPMGKTAALAEAKTWLRNLSRSEMGKRTATLSNGMERGKHAGEPRPEAAGVPAPVAAAKSNRPYAHPYFWAAFVLVGHAD